MRRVYIGENIFWAYLRDDKKAVPFIWSKDRSEVLNIETGEVLEYLKDDRLLHDIIKLKYAQKQQTSILEFPKVIAMLEGLEKGKNLAVEPYTNPNKILYSKKQLLKISKKIEELIIKKEKQEELQK